MDPRTDDHADHDHGHDHDHAHGDPHDHSLSLWARIRHVIAPHSHDAIVSMDTELETSRKGMRALLISFGALMVTALLQAALVAFTGSIA